jgi:hypothetical protein
MAMEIHVLSDRRLLSIAEWQRAIDAEGFALTLSDETPFDSIGGFLPAKLGGTDTGFECDHWDPNDTYEAYADIPFPHRWRYELSFRWSADIAEWHAAWMAAAAYAAATSGIVFDPQTSKLLSPAEARADVVKLQREIPEIEANVRAVIAQVQKDRSGER